MSLSIGEPPSPTFRQPLELMSDCHRRVESFLGVLRRIGESMPPMTPGSDAATALATALRYFREAAPKHTADEEESLFPRMRALPGPGVAKVLGRIQRLEEEHRLAAESHAAIERTGSRWLADGRITAGEAEEFRFHVDRLLGIYTAHIACEDQEVFPLAARLLSPADLGSIGREMAARRGQPYVHPGFAGR